MKKCCCLCCNSNCCFLVKPTINNSLLFVHSITFDYHPTQRRPHLPLGITSIMYERKMLRKNIRAQQSKNIHYVIVLYCIRYCSNMYMIITLPTQAFFVSLERKKFCNYQSYANYD